MKFCSEDGKICQPYYRFGIAICPYPRFLKKMNLYHPEDGGSSFRNNENWSRWHGLRVAERKSFSQYLFPLVNYSLV
jgi:hypothetical protein